MHDPGRQYPQYTKPITEGQILPDFYLHEVCKRVRLLEAESRMVFAEMRGGENEELLFKGYKVSIMQDE